jgi:signal transduction histidine kinase
MRGKAKRLALFGTAVGLFLAQLTAMLLPDSVTGVTLASDVIPFLVPLVGAAGCFVAARKVRSEERAFWVYMGLGALAWGLGDIGYSLYGWLDFDPAGKLTLADAGYLALVPMWAAAFIVHPSRSRRGIDRLGTSVDAMVVFAVAATVTVTYVLQPALRTATDVPGAIVNTAYPVCDLVLLAVLVSMRARSADRMGVSDTLIALAAAVFAFGDIAYARLSIVDAYDVGHPIDLTWTLAFVLVSLAAGRTLTSQKTESEDGRSSFPVLAAAGMVGIWVLAGLAALNGLRDAMLLIGAAATGLLLVTRLAILLADRGHLVRDLDRKVKELEDARAARERFIATVSHDLRSPLASISGFAELLREPEVLADRVQVEQMTTSIERNARRLARMTEDLLCAGQFASGHPPPLRLGPVDLRQVTEEVVNDMGRAANVVVEGDRWVYAMADKQRVQQILVNLVENAFKHSGSNEVSIRIAAEEDGSVLEVSDKGVGISPERIRQIFEPFVSDFARASNVGLGLYVVANLVSAMSGRISVTSELEHGTTFRVAFPSAVPEPVFGDVVAAS